MKKEKIGFFGGCFNPPTNIHISLAKNLIESGIVDKVIFVPVGNYYKKQNLVPAIHRYNMLTIACKGQKALGVEDIACMHTNTLYAVDTFKLIYDKYDKIANIFFIMGSDNFKKMPSWKEYNQIIKNYKFIVIQRFKTDKNIKLDNLVYYMPEKMQSISSTQIRKMIQEHQNVDKWLGKETIKYIVENGIYI